MINQIVQVDTNDELRNATITLNKVLDEILLQPTGPTRWRAVVDVLHKTNPIAGEDSQGHSVRFREVNKECVVVNAAMRETAGDKYGRSTDNQKSVYRGYLSMPRIVKTMIEIVDPNAFRGEKNAKKMFETFKEYRTADAH